MTPLNTIIEEEKKAFEKRFPKKEELLELDRKEV